MRIRGLMADPPRLVENLDYYYRLVDFCADWGCNTLLFRLTDDQGSALRFPSHPELLTHKAAFAADELRGLVEHAQKRGVDLIPEIESFGHSWYITRTDRYRHLLDDAGRADFSGLTPLHPDAIALLTDLFRDVAAIFPSRYLHAGCDEVDWGNTAFSRSLLKDATRSQVWARWLNTLNDIARANGKEMLVWADHLLRGDPSKIDSVDCLTQLDKSIILVDWHYSEDDADEIERHARRALAAGLRVIGSPALLWSRWGARANTRQQDNIDAFALAYQRIEDERALGMIVTHWCPTRYIQNSQWDGLAYAALAMAQGPHWARQNAMETFVDRHFGAAADTHWQRAMSGLQDAVLPVKGRGGDAWRQFTADVWSDDDGLLALAGLRTARSEEFAVVRSELAMCAGSVRRNWPDFRALDLTARYLEHIHWRSQVVLELADGPFTQDQAAELARIIGQRDADMGAALEEDWRATRGRSMEFLDESLPRLRPADELHRQARLASEYTAELANDPGRFAGLLQKLREARITAAEHAKPAGH